MPQKATKLNHRAQLKTWHFASVLTPTHEIRADIYWLATNNINAAHAHNLLVKACSRKTNENDPRPACVTFISWRFSFVDAMSWISNAKARLPLQDLPFEGYIQSTDVIDLPRLHHSVSDAIWENVGNKLS